jgi:hypothetical protein
MGILDNFENVWDDDFQFESNPISEKDAMGREKFWEDLGRPISPDVENDGLALKIFKDQCCDQCNCN